MLSDEAAEAVARRQNAFHASGLETLSPSAAEPLGHDLRVMVPARLR